ncbi:MAG: type II secretion system protein [Pseudomonadota bacterium]
MTVKRNSAGGFTLIEAVVALVIMATTLTGLYSWINTELLSLRRVEAVIVTTELAQEALRQIQVVPLDSKPEGEMMLGEYRMVWTATPVEAPRSGLGRSGGLSLYDVTLFDVAFSLYADDESLGEWSLRELRHLQVRQPPDE